MEIEQFVSCDVLVVGSGLAGLRAAYDAAASGLDVILISKGRFCSGASFYPLTGGLGAQVPVDDHDKQRYLEELLDAGDGIADENLCRIMVDEIAVQTNRLGDLGIDVYEASGRPACFAKRERILKVWKDWGKIRRNAQQIFSSISNITMMPHSDLIKIVTRDSAISGALIVDAQSRLVLVTVPAVVLVAGGYCGLYKHSLNTDDVCGIGHSAALEAGAQLVNMEFMQFIPGLTSPVYKLLFGEITLWHCRDILNQDRKPVLREFLPSDVSFEQCIHDRSMHGPFTTRDASKYLELAIMQDVIENGREEGFIIQYDPSIAEDPNQLVGHVLDLYKRHGIDLSRQEISIAPFAHCANGGIKIDQFGRTSVAGLFAAGEASGGVHGADRHGGAATSVCLVFGARAAAGVASYLKEHRSPGDVPKHTLEELMDWIDTGTNTSISPHQVMHHLREKLWYQANILRSEQLSGELLAWIQIMRRDYNAARCIDSGYDIKQSMEAFHALRTSESLLRAMLFRKESRGPHYRSDFPERNEELTGSRIRIEESGQGMNAGYIKW